ncbi:MAG: VPLPA-CTERM sorting domain-containing protein [Fimbriimonadales bacterium]
MMLKRVLTSVTVATVLISGALANWNITVINSSGVLNPPSTVVSVPTLTMTNPLPQITFLTSAGVPNPILVGDGTSFTNGTFSGAYSISPTVPSPTPLTGFNFVIAGIVDRSAMIVWQKKVVRNSDNAILYNRSGTIAGSGFGGTDGAFNIVLNETLSAPATDVTVYENFLLFVLPTNPTSTAGLLLVEQDWVPEPASMLALTSGLAGLIAMRRRKR